MKETHHKFFFGFAGIIMLFISLFFSIYIADMGNIDLEVLNLALLLTITILLLMTGGIILEIKNSLLQKPKKKR